VLKWVLAALAAGFIGQFGRSLALRIIERRRRNREAESRTDQTVIQPSTVEPTADALAAQAKLEKKKAKAEVKRLKKSPRSKEKNGDA